MKKILLATAFIMMVGLFANAQGRDVFFSNWDNGNRVLEENTTLNISNPGMGNFGNGNNEQAPLGSGLLVLTALGAGYAVVRKRNK